MIWKQISILLKIWLLSYSKSDGINQLEFIFKRQDLNTSTVKWHWVVEV